MDKKDSLRNGKAKAMHLNENKPKYNLVKKFAEFGIDVTKM